MQKTIRGIDLLVDLRKASASVSGPLTVSKYKEVGEYSVQPAINRYGSWNEAKSRAGLETIEPGGYTKRAKTRDQKETELRSLKEESPCQICEENPRYPAMDFHHKNPDDKIACIGNMTREGYSFEEIDAEIEKCAILCANCHRELEAGLRDPPWGGGRFR